MIEILNTWRRTVIYKSETAQTIAEAVVEAKNSGAKLSGAKLSGADLSGADLSRADLSGADLYGAELSRAKLSSAKLSGADLSCAKLSCADLSCADLSRADLSRADLFGTKLSGAKLSCADLSRADLSRADLYGAEGIDPKRCTPLLLLLDQPGKIRAYKLVTSEGEGPYNGGITYEIGKSYCVGDANTDVNEHCAPGINLATLDWCMREWREGYRILVAEFTAQDIAAIPTATDGKFRVHRCEIVGEKDVRELRLVIA